MNPPLLHHTANAPAGSADTLPLRNSCEACASAKLRCPKEKPTCHRCAKRGILCEYFTIKRAGRKPSSRSSVNGGSTNSNNGRPCPPDRMQSFPGAGQGPDPQGVLSEQLLMLDQKIPQYMDTDGISDVWFTTDRPDFDFFDTDNHLTSVQVEGRSNSSSSSDSSSNSSSGSGGGLDTSTRHESFSTTFAHLDTMMPELMALTTPTSSEWNISFPELDLTAESSPCSCLAEATGLITRLSQLSSTVGTTWAAIDMDNATALRLAANVVEQNKTTINAVSAILNCPNFHDGSLLAIISFVIFKMLSLYAAIACKDPNLQNLPSSNAARPTPQMEPLFAMDKYNLETTDPQHMAGRLVLGELHRVRHLIAQLVEKLKSQSITQERGDGAETQESMDLDCEMRLPLSAVMYEQLDLDLRRRLKALSWAIVDRMTRL